MKLLQATKTLIDQGNLIENAWCILGKGPYTKYVDKQGGGGSTYVVNLSTEGGQKSSKSYLRSLCMAPKSTIALEACGTKINKIGLLKCM